MGRCMEISVGIMKLISSGISQQIQILNSLEIHFIHPFIYSKKAPFSPQKRLIHSSRGERSGERQDGT